MDEAGGERRTFPRWLVVLGAVALVGLGVWALRNVLTPIFFAWIIAYLLDPVVDRFEKWKLPRAAGIVALLTIVLGAAGLFLFLAVPAIARDVIDFGRELPARFGDLRARVEPWLVDHGIALPATLDEAISSVRVDADTVASGAAAPVGRILGWVVGETASVIGAILGILIVPVLAFYLLHDFDRITAAVRDLVPHRTRPAVVEIAGEIDRMIAAWVRGQSTVMFVLAVLYSVAFTLIGVRLGLVIGLLGGLLSFIPYIGGGLCLTLALLMCALDGASPMTYVWVLAAYGAIQAADGLFITPRIVGEKVGLPAIGVLVALMVGGELLGFLGVLLAVPSAAIAKILVSRLVAHYKKSRAYLAEAVPAVESAAEAAPDPAPAPPTVEKPDAQ